ncbi:DHX35-like protein, partial [Mya arenaria]
EEAPGRGLKEERGSGEEAPGRGLQEERGSGREGEAQPAVRNHILYMVEKYQTVVIVGSTGCGKSTQIPQYLLEAGWGDEGHLIGITQPRRVAAITVANRIAEEKGCLLGDEVGYLIRFDDCTDAHKTRIKCMTDGMLIREIMQDPLLSKYSKDTAAILSIEGRTHPDNVIHLNYRNMHCNFIFSPVPDYVKATVETIVKIHNNEKQGDVLAFLTGMVSAIVGFVKIKNYHPKTGIESLIVVPVSQASADQRAGRAGRVRAGKAFRLYT